MSDIREGYARLWDYGYIVTEDAPMRGMLVVNELMRIERGFVGMPDNEETRLSRRNQVLSLLRGEESKRYVVRVENHDRTF